MVDGTRVKDGCGRSRLLAGGAGRRWGRGRGRGQGRVGGRVRQAIGVVEAWGVVCSRWMGAEVGAEVLLAEERVGGEAGTGLC